MTSTAKTTSKTSAILELAGKPQPFDLPKPPPTCDQAATDWRNAGEHVAELATARRQRRLTLNGLPELNRRTLEFIRDGAPAGDRHRLLFSAAANLAEFGCPLALAHALLTESALDSGLAPNDVRRQIECGLTSIQPNLTHQDCGESPQAGRNGSPITKVGKRDTADSVRFQRLSCQEMTGVTE